MAPRTSRGGWTASSSRCLVLGGLDADRAGWKWGGLEDPDFFQVQGCCKLSKVLTRSKPGLSVLAFCEGLGQKAHEVEIWR